MLCVRLSAPHGQPVLCTLLGIVWLQLCVRGLSLSSGGLLPAVVEALRLNAKWSTHTHDLDAAGDTVATRGAVVAQCAALKALAMLNSKTNAPVRQMVTKCVADFPVHGRRNSGSSCSCASCCSSPWATNVSACRSGQSTTMRQG